MLRVLVSELLAEGLVCWVRRSILDFGRLGHRKVSFETSRGTLDRLRRTGYATMGA